MSQNINRIVSDGVQRLLSSSLIISISGFLTTFFCVNRIGFDQYGVFAGVFSVTSFIELVVKSEIKSVLVKKNYKSNSTFYDTLFTLSIIILAIYLVVIVIVYLLYIEFNGFKYNYILLFTCLSFLLPLSLLNEMPRAILESDNRFKAITKHELTSSLSQHLIIIISVIQFKSYWVLTLGWVIYNVSIGVLSWKSVSYKPKFNINKIASDELINHYKHVGFQTILREGHKLVNPFVVGYFIGASSVGLISIIEKLVMGFVFISNAFKRVLNGVLGDISINTEYKIDLIKEFIPIFNLLLFSVLTLSGLIYKRIDWFLPDFKPVLRVFGLIAISFLINQSTYLLQLPLLLNGNLKVLSIQQVITSFILFSFSGILIYHFGIFGYALAFFIASCSNIYILIKYKSIFKEKISVRNSIMLVTMSILMILFF